jgi:hypothetical protein
MSLNYVFGAVSSIAVIYIISVGCFVLIDIYDRYNLINIEYNPDGSINHTETDKKSFINSD